MVLGVMRFLQIEWHNHERARNAWDIERAEMKQKITRMQGENNNLKRTKVVLEKHVKMLEKVITDERIKHLAAASGEKTQADDSAEIDIRAKAALKAELKNGMFGSPLIWMLANHVISQPKPHSILFWTWRMEPTTLRYQPTWTSRESFYQDASRKSPFSCFRPHIHLLRIPACNLSPTLLDTSANKRHR
jgi:hypothetical protein